MTLNSGEGHAELSVLLLDVEFGLLKKYLFKLQILAQFNELIQQLIMLLLLLSELVAEVFVDLLLRLLREAAAVAQRDLAVTAVGIG